MIVEEDGDEIFTAMPERCLKWECHGAKVAEKDGFMVCENCGCSYGAALKGGKGCTPIFEIQLGDCAELIRHALEHDDPKRVMREFMAARPELFGERKQNG